MTSSRESTPTHRQQDRPKTTNDIASNHKDDTVSDRLKNAPTSDLSPPASASAPSSNYQRRRRHHRRHSSQPSSSLSSTNAMYHSGDLRSFASSETTTIDNELISEPSTVPHSECTSGASSPSINIYHHMTPPPPPPGAAALSDALPPLTTHHHHPGQVHHIPIYVETLTGVTFEMQVTPTETVLQVKQKLEFAEGIAAVRSFVFISNYRVSH